MAPATSRRPREGLAQSRVVTGVIAGLLMLVACSTYYVTHRQDGYLDNLARAPNFSPRDTSRESDAAATHSAAETHTKVSLQITSGLSNGGHLGDTVRGLGVQSKPLMNSGLRQAADKPAAAPLRMPPFAELAKLPAPGQPGSDPLKGTRGGGNNGFMSPMHVQSEVEGSLKMSERPGYVAFMGVFSSGNLGGEKRRGACRGTWFPGTEKELLAFEAEHNMKIRFIVGKPNKGKGEHLDLEEKQFGQMVRINVVEEYDNLKFKMMRFFTTVPRLFNARYYLKVDDDIYFRPDRVPLAAVQWAGHDADYIGCKRRGGVMWGTHTSRYFDPQRHLINEEKYYLYQAGPAYAISRWGVELLMSIPEDGLRFFGGGDASFGAWFLAFNVTHMDDMRMCCGACKPNMLGYWEISKCNGICNPETTMARVHTEECGASPTLPPGATELPETRRSYEISKEKCHKLHDDWIDHSQCRRGTP